MLRNVLCSLGSYGFVLKLPKETCTLGIFSVTGKSHSVDDSLTSEKAMSVEAHAHEV